MLVTLSGMVTLVRRAAQRKQLADAGDTLPMVTLVRLLQPES